MAAASIASSGPRGAEAAKTLCAVIGNIIRSPDEHKYRQLKWCGLITHQSTPQTQRQPLSTPHGQSQLSFSSISMACKMRLQTLCRDCSCASMLTSDKIVSAIHRFALLLRMTSDTFTAPYNCSSNARVANTLAVPGAFDLLTQLGFEHTPDSANQASNSSASPQPFEPDAPSGTIALPMELPGPNEALFHGALSLLRPLVSDVATGAAPVRLLVDAPLEPQSCHSVCTHAP